MEVFWEIYDVIQADDDDKDNSVATERIECVSSEANGSEIDNDELAI